MHKEGGTEEDSRHSPRSCVICCLAVVHLAALHVSARQLLLRLILYTNNRSADDDVTALCTNLPLSTSRGVVTAVKPVRAEQVRRPERVGLFCLGLSMDGARILTKGGSRGQRSGHRGQ